MKFLYKILIFFVFMTVLGSKTTYPQVSFSASGSFYEHPFPLTLSSNSGTIHYTLDGSTPTTQSPTYTSPLVLSPELYSSRNLFLEQIAPDDWWNPPTSVNHVIAIRAAAFDNLGNRIGKESFNTYFISDLTGYSPQLPMLSITIDPACLLAADSGIFSLNGWNPNNDFYTGNFNQHGREWERLANIEFYELNGNGFSQQLGMRVHGGKTRRFMQKPLKLYARKEYGKKYINYPIFETIPYSSYKRLVLRPFSASWQEDGISDRLAQSIAAPLHCVSLATRPITVYINGEYWGIYYLQQSTDERLVEQIDNVDADDVNLIGSWYGMLENGSNTGFNQMMNYLNTASLSDTLQYQYICSLIDIDNFIDYQLLESFVSNLDWPANNMKCFQHDFSLWRWIFYDGDAAFGNADYDMTIPLTYTGEEEWPSSYQSTLCFRKLLESPIFFNRIYTRMTELTATTFSYSNTAPLLYSAIAEVQFDVNRQSERFNNPTNFSGWETATNNIDIFLQKRPSIFKSQMLNLFSIPTETTTSGSFLFYPNPAHNTINVSFTNDVTGFVQYEIFDCIGHVILRNELLVSEQSTYSIDISTLPVGVYLVRFSTSPKMYKLVVR